MKHAGFPHDGDVEVEAHLVESESGDEATEDLSQLDATERERLQREARRAYEEAGGVTGGTETHGYGEGSGVEEPRGAASEVAAEALDTAEDSSGRLAEVIAQRDEFLESLQRLQAEFENYRKRVMRNETAAAERATERFVAELLPVLDTIDLAQRHAAQGQPVEGTVSMVASSLAEFLNREGLERIDPVGATFDPAEHDAVAHVPDDGPSQGEPEVVEVMRAGYRFRGKVLRPAMVRVRS